MPEVGLYKQNPIPKKGERAFSLLELLIVILLLSLMAMLIFGSMSRQRAGEETLEPSEIKELAKDVPQGNAELVCVDNCNRCFFWDTDRRTHALSYRFKPLAAYTVNRFGETIKIDFGRFRDHPVCLRFQFRPNGSTSRLIIKSSQKYFFIPAYFGKVRTFDSLEEAAVWWRRNSDLLQNDGDYY